MKIHISLNVMDLEASVRWYQTLFGQEPSKQKKQYANFRLKQPPIHLALEQSPKAAKSQSSHFGIELADHETLDAWHSRLENAGISLAIEQNAECCYAKADKLWLKDPDGNPWEIWVRTGNVDEMGHTSVMLPEQSFSQPACCN